MSAPEVETSDASRHALESRGLTVDYALDAGVRPVTTKDELAAVAPELAGSPWASVPGLLFPWTNPADGEVVWQLRPDVPVTREDGSAVKYVFPEGRYQNLGKVRAARSETPRVSLIVEGTMQSLAAARYAPDDVEVYAIPGCWGWSEQQVPTGALASLRGDVRVCLDADAATNRDVYDAGARLADAVEGMTGETPLFLRIASGGNQGLDDMLAVVPEDRRSPVLDNLIKAARAKPADRMPKPKKTKKSGAFGHATFVPGEIDPNDTAVATNWADQGATARWRMLLDGDQWLGYRLGRWEQTSKHGPYNDLARYCADLSERYLTRVWAGEIDDEDREKVEEAARMLLAHNKIQTVLFRAAGHDEFHVRRDQLDTHPTLWPAGNAVVDLFTGEQREHDPALLLTVGSDVIYDPEAACPRFDEFLADILPDPEVRGYVLRLFGVAMLGEVRANAQVFTVFVGSGRNGKGALVRTMERLFGAMSVTIDPRALQERKHEEHLTEIAKMAGKRLATAQEPEAGKPWNTGRIKSWTGGDRLTGRFMRGDEFAFTPSHTLIVTANDRPPVPRSDSAFWMRYREVPFEVSVEGREDPGLESHIADHELPGVLNRVLEGLSDYLAHGLAEPSAVIAATHDAQSESDHLATWAAEHLVRTDDPTDRLSNAEAQEACRKWWSQNVRSEPMPADRGRNSFKAQLQRVYGIVESEKNPRYAKIDNVSRLAWHGFRWLGDDGCGEGGPVADIPPLPGPDIRNRPGPDVPSSDDLPGSVADIGDQVAEDESDTATKLIYKTLGQSDEVAEVAEVADIDTVTSTGENTPTDSIKKGVKKTRQEDAFPNHGHNGSHSATPQPRQPSALPEATSDPVIFDLETGDAAEAHTAADPLGFVRLGGYLHGRERGVTTDPRELIKHVVSSRKVIGHNIVGFDLPALARIDPRVDVLALARAGRIHDTMIVESVLWPVLNDKSAGAAGKAMRYYGLDATAERHGLEGKTDDVKRLAKQHGGWDRIPVDDESEDGRAFRSYCDGDVMATTRIAAVQSAELGRRSPDQLAYLQREHRVHAIASTMGVHGLAVDEAELQARFWQGYGHKQDMTRRLVAQYGIPTTKADGKPADSPAATRGGKEAALRALHALGADLSLMEKTKTGAPAFGGDPMTRFAEAHEGHPNAEEIAGLCDLMGGVAAVRAVYGTALQYLGNDGRVHPTVATLQASGRWSVTKPGLTVFGKRGGRVVERGIFTAGGEPGPDSEFVLFTADFSQIDQRAVAVHSQDHAYMDLFAPGKDSHAEVAMRVWGDPKRRSDAKVVGHGWNYGMGLGKLAAEVGSEQVAREFDQAMRDQFPRLVAWREEVREQAAAQGWLDNGFGRRMPVDPDRAHTQAPALMGQGCARDLAMEALLAMDDDLVHHLRAFVHDEIVVECRRDEVDEIKHRIAAAMNFEWTPPHGTRPITIEAEPGPHAFAWDRCYD